MNRTIARVRQFLIALLVGASVAGVPAGAQDKTLDEEQLIQRLKAEILKELREGGLQQEIDAGIQRYVEQQREARRAAQEAQARQAADQAKKVRPVSAERDHIRGNPQAKLSLIEYSDFECPYCKRFHATPKQLLQAYDGRVNWVYRHFPLSFHNPGAQKEAEASECAAELGGNDAFWKYADAIYARTTSNGKGFPLGNLVPLAEEIGLDGAAFKDCLDSGRQAARVREDFEEGSRVGISGTPGTILRDNETGEVRVLKGAMPFAQVKAAVDQLLK